MEIRAQTFTVSEFHAYIRISPSYSLDDPPKDVSHECTISGRVLSLNSIGYLGVLTHWGSIDAMM